MKTNQQKKDISFEHMEQLKDPTVFTIEENYIEKLDKQNSILGSVHIRENMI